MKILMICLGNICRSPLAEGILQAKVDEIGLNWQIESAGTSNYHEGEKPDLRSQEVAFQNGININNQHSRHLVSADLDEFDLILAMDSFNYQNIQKLKTDTSKAKVELIMNYSIPGRNINVPDPYYQSGGFDEIYKMLDSACEALIEKINK